MRSEGSREREIAERERGRERERERERARETIREQNSFGGRSRTLAIPALPLKCDEPTSLYPAGMPYSCVLEPCCLLVLLRSEGAKWRRARVA